MTRFPTSSIGKQLSVGFGLIFLLLAVLGAAVFVWHSQSASAQRAFLERIAPLAERADQLERSLLQVGIDVRSYLLSPDQERLNRYRQSFEGTREAMRRLDQAPKDADGEELARQIAARITPYLEEADRLLKRHSQIPVDSAEEATLSELRERATVSVQRFEDLQRGKIALAIGKMQTARDRVSSGLIAVILLGGLMSAAIAWVTTQSVRRPVNALVDVAGSLEEGNWEPALALIPQARSDPAEKLPSKGEIRRLARAIGFAAQSLEQREQRLQAQNEELQVQNEELQAQNEEIQSQGEELQAQSEELQAQHEEIEAQNERLKLQAEELGEADRRKNRFLGVLAHELRNPMAPISNSLALLKRAPPGSEHAVRAQAMIERQARHLTRLIDDLLDVTRISQGKIRLQREELDFIELVRACLEDQQATLESGERNLSFTAPPAPVRVNGDRTRLSQVVGNLLSNAVKFTDRGGHITVALEVEPARRLAQLRIGDDGIGLDPQLIPQLFQPFTQGAHSIDRVNGGLGLGLSLVKALVDLHGGGIDARSDGPGRGAEFVVRLPLEG